MKRVLLSIAFVLTMGAAADAGYGYSTSADSPVKQGNYCNFGATLTYGAGDTPLTDIEVKVTAPDGSVFTPSYTRVNGSNYVLTDGGFSPSQIGTYNIIFHGKDQFGTITYSRSHAISCISRYP